MEGYPSPPASSADERRITQRRRIIKTGVIAYSGKHMTLPCVVRDLSDTGARLQVQDVRQIPDLFELLIELDGFHAECSVAWRENTQVGVSFTSSPDSFAPKRA